MRSIKGRCLVSGVATGKALVSIRAFTFAHGVDPETGKVTDVRSDLNGKNVKGKVLFYPYGKGSTTASSWFLEAVRRGNAPAALVTNAVDLSAVIGSVMAKLVYAASIPVISGVDPSLASGVGSDSEVRVDGPASSVVIEE